MMATKFLFDPMNEKECPNCGEAIDILDRPIQANCRECGRVFNIDYDGEFVDGLWRDRTKLIAA